MNIIVISKKAKILNDHIARIKPEAGLISFNACKDAFEVIKDNVFDVAIINVDDIDTIVLCKELRKDNEKINFIFTTSKKSYTEETLCLKASAYLFEPISNSLVEQELNELRYPVKEKICLLRVQCFGNFSVFTANGELIKFSREKSKELLAYLIYKKGTEVTTKEIGAILFEDQAYDNKQKTYLQQIYHSLAKDLKAYGADEVLIKNYNSTCINPDVIDCDYFRFNENDDSAKRMYTGEFMMQYEWADYVTGYLEKNL